MELTIKGTHALSEKLIQSKILSTPTSWVPFSAPQLLDESAFEADLKRILRLYQSRGYYRARILDRKVTPLPGRRVAVEITIEEGPQALISDIVVEGLADLPPEEQARLLSRPPLAEKDVFEEARYDDFKDQLGESLLEAGFAEVEVNGLVEVDTERNEVLVVIHADKGPRYRFGEIFVAGANRIPRKKLAAIAREAVPEGATYRDSALGEAQTKLFDLGVFSAVKVTRGAPDRQERSIPIVVNVREAPFKTLRLGAGAGLDAKRQEVPRLIAEWTHRNFFGGLRKLTLTSKLALAFLPSVLSAIEDPERFGPAVNVSAAFAQPEVILRDLTLEAGVEYERGVDQAFRFHAGKGRVGLLYRLSRDLTFSPSYNFSVFKLTGTAAAAVGGSGRRQEAVLDLCAQTGELCVLSFLEQRVALDKRDNPVSPTRGAYVALSLQQGSAVFAGDYRYLRVLPEVRAYLPLGEHVIASRLRAGVLLPRDEGVSSVLTRFFLGGSTSERGYGNRNLSPKLVVPSSRGPANAEELPIGGNGMVEGNLELRLSLPKSLGLVGFVDAGQVTREAKALGLENLQVAAGIGLRYHTLFGPVRLDLAWRVVERPLPRDFIVDVDPDGNPLVPPSDQAGKIFGLQLPTLHFSIGEAF